MAAKIVSLKQKKGAASALIILLLVLLIFFGVLALVAGAADLRLAKRRAEWNTDYYLADSQAQQLLGLISQTCRQTSFLEEMPAVQARILAEQLAGQAQLSEPSVAAIDDTIVLDALVHSPVGADRGIEMTVLIQPGTDQLFTISRWNWWHEPFAYGDSFEGVWDGKSG